MSDEAREAAREQLANMIPLGFTERDPYRNVFEAADAILASDWLAARDAEMRAEGIRQAREAVEGLPTTWLNPLVPAIGKVDALEAIDALVTT